MIYQLIAAMIGTVAFSVLFGVPRKYYLYCGLIGGAGWAIYSGALCVFGPAESSLIATMVVILLSRFAAIWKSCPVTVFLISGIFPLVCISSSVFPKNRKEKFPTLGMGYSHISAGNIFI